MSEAAPQQNDRVRLLTFTNLFPNPEQPGLGLFVERRLSRLVALGRINAVVVAPVPWFPFRNTRFAGYGKFARIPRSDVRGGIQVYHPRYLSLPGLNQFTAPLFMFIATLRLCARLKRTFGVEVVDAHYLYPDAGAAAAISRVLKLPLVASARGTDVNLLPEYAIPRAVILWVTRVARRVITVSDALRERLESIGADRDKIETLRNGVDLVEFAPRDKTEARRKLGIADQRIVISVGNLVEEKGHQLAVEAISGLDDVLLVVIGDGPMRQPLEQLAARGRARDRVRFTGSLSTTDLLDYYSAADLLVLASSREGMPNVVLEALACGLPVVATDCGGVREVLDAAVGVLVAERKPDAIAAAVAGLLANPPARCEVRRYAARLGWEPTIDRQSALYHEAAQAGAERGGRHE